MSGVETKYVITVTLNLFLFFLNIDLNITNKNVIKLNNDNK